MKNKEIEELLNKLKTILKTYKELKVEPTLCEELITTGELNLLLSYIEQLEKRNKEIYEGFMATQEELTDYATENEQLENENQQLKKQKDDVVKLIYKKMRDVDIYGTQIFDLDELLRMLGEIDEI